MRIALIQTNPVIGDFARNSSTVLYWMRKAKNAGCRLAIFPELTLSGYPPQDLLERADFIAAHDRQLQILMAQTRDIAIIIGAIEPRSSVGKFLYNSAMLIDRGRIIGRARKQLLPTYDVFDETRYFEPGTESTVVNDDGEQIEASKSITSYDASGNSITKTETWEKDASGNIIKTTDTATISMRMDIFARPHTNIDNSKESEVVESMPDFFN